MRQFAPPLPFSVLRATVFVALCSCPLVAFAQEDDLLAYFPMQVGAFWAFESQLSEQSEATESTNTSGTTEGNQLAFFLSSREVGRAGKTVVRRDQSNGNFRLQRIDDQGLWLESVHFLGDTEVRFQEPVLVVPSQLDRKAPHHAEVPYITVTLGVETDKGTQMFDVSRLENASVSTLAGTFSDCLVTLTKTLRSGADGASRGYSLTEWRAKDVGLVKIEGEFFWNDVQGKRISTKLIHMVLSGAQVQGQVVEDLSR